MADGALEFICKTNGVRKVDIELGSAGSTGASTSHTRAAPASGIRAVLARGFT